MKEILTERLRKKRRCALTEERHFSGKTIISVDIQPEYSKAITFDLYRWISFLESNYQNNRIIFLYNGDTMGFDIDENAYKQWLMEELNASEELIDTIEFYDKGYAFFRYCIDKYIEDDQIVAVIQFMVKNNINDSRDMDETMWAEFIKQYPSYIEVYELLKDEMGDMINVPDLMEYLTRFSNIVVMGGGINECLKEVELALMALEKPYTVLNEFVY